MGMDITGIEPSSPAGEYFRANIWSWAPIYALIVELCSDVLDEETLRCLGFNDGDGPDSQATCTEMANRFEAWMEHHTEGHILESSLRVDRKDKFVSEEECEEAVSPYKVTDEHLKEWIEFLRHCGGFEVW